MLLPPPSSTEGLPPHPHRPLVCGPWWEGRLRPRLSLRAAGRMQEKPDLLQEGRGAHRGGQTMSSTTGAVTWRPVFSWPVSSLKLFVASETVWRHSGCSRRKLLTWSFRHRIKVGSIAPPCKWGFERLCPRGGRSLGCLSCRSLSLGGPGWTGEPPAVLCYQRSELEPAEFYQAVRAWRWGHLGSGSRRLCSGPALSQAGALWFRTLAVGTGPSLVSPTLPHFLP